MGRLGKRRVGTSKEYKAQRKQKGKGLERMTWKDLGRVSNNSDRKERKRKQWKGTR